MTKKDPQERWLYAITKNANGDQNNQYYVFYDDDIYEYRLLDTELTNQNIDMPKLLEQYDDIQVLEAEIIDEFEDEKNQGYIYIIYAAITTEIPEAKTVSAMELKTIIDNSSVLNNTVRQHLLARIGEYS